MKDIKSRVGNFMVAKKKLNPNDTFSIDESLYIKFIQQYTPIY